MINVKFNKGCLKLLEISGNIVDISSDMSAIIHAVYNALCANDEEAGEAFKQHLELIFSDKKLNDLVFRCADLSGEKQAEKPETDKELDEKLDKAVDALSEILKKLLDE